MKQKVVIIGHGYTSRLGMIRAYGSCGYEVIVIVMAGSPKNKPIDCYSRYVSSIYYCPSDREALINLLLDKCADPEQKVVIIPDSDFSAAAIDLNQDRLRDYFVFPNIGGEQGAVVGWMNKIRQKNTAAKVGLNYAKCWTVRVVDGKFDLPDDIGYPCFPKPMATIVGGKGGMKRCNDETELRGVIARLSAYQSEIEILIEEFKNIETEYAVLGYSDGGNVIIPGVIEILSLANGGHFGVAKCGRIMPTEDFSDLIEKFRLFVKETGFLGIFDIDFYKSDGIFFFGEMNLRYGGSGYALTKMGVNIPDMLARRLLGLGLDGMQTAISSTAVYANERMCISDWSYGYISTCEYLRILKKADIRFIKDPDDPDPQKQFLRSHFNFRMNAKRIVKRFLYLTNR